MLMVFSSVVVEFWAGAATSNCELAAWQFTSALRKAGIGPKNIVGLSVGMQLNVRKVSASTNHEAGQYIRTPRY